jgi:hypothetical protein
MALDPTCSADCTYRHHGFHTVDCGRTPMPDQTPGAGPVTCEERCRARSWRESAEPTDCDFPFCGCFAQAERAVQALKDIGWHAPEGCQSAAVPSASGPAVTPSALQTAHAALSGGLPDAAAVVVNPLREAGAQARASLTVLRAAALASEGT